MWKEGGGGGSSGGGGDSDIIPRPDDSRPRLDDSHKRKVDGDAGPPGAKRTPRATEAGGGGGGGAHGGHGGRVGDIPLSLSTRPHDHGGGFPFYRQPVEVGCFSLDAERRFHADARQLRYYAPPKGDDDGEGGGGGGRGRVRDGVRGAASGQRDAGRAGADGGHGGSGGGCGERGSGDGAGDGECGGHGLTAGAGDNRGGGARAGGFGVAATSGGGGGGSGGGATRVEFDLRDGYPERYVQRDDDIKEKLDHVLRWILPNRYKFALAGETLRDSAAISSLHTDVVTWRGHLTKVACTPYERHEGWLMAVTLLAGTRYMSEMETEEARRQRGTRDARQREMTYWGYKFEQYLCAETPGGIPDPGGIVNTNEAFCTVVRTRLKSHSLVFAGEVDCLSCHNAEVDKHRDAEPATPARRASGQRPQQQQHSSNYVELKTSRELYTPNQRRNLHRFKLIKWWAQSFLVGVPKIVAGFRDDEGVVRRLQTFETLHIPKMVADDQEAWNGSVCLNFVEAFLTFMKKVVTKDDPKTVYLFSWEPGRDVTYSVHPDSELAFLPD
ncbi:decapping and exoribonuclease protein isoform X3 [Lethenteron reissneri]|nr:decapping and exoribonuclease protein isoform X2 [Lethenteron reissneri]XP_061414487.1 decapping and exoribonuclease protein isoform X3 [Lethenteron reissneri]